MWLLCVGSGSSKLGQIPNYFEMLELGIGVLLLLDLTDEARPGELSISNRFQRVLTVATQFRGEVSRVRAARPSC